MSDDDTTHLSLAICSAIASSLFIISELLGMSNCKSNGVFQYVFSCCRKVYAEIDIEEQVNSEERTRRICCLTPWNWRN